MSKVRPGQDKSLGENKSQELIRPRWHVTVSPTQCVGERKWISRPWYKRFMIVICPGQLLNQTTTPYHSIMCVISWHWPLSLVEKGERAIPQPIKMHSRSYTMRLLYPGVVERKEWITHIPDVRVLPNTEVFKMEVSNVEWIDWSMVEQITLRHRILCWERYITYTYLYRYIHTRGIHENLWPCIITIT